MSKDSSEKIIEQIKKLAESICEDEELEFVHAEFAKLGKTKLLRVYIDKENGIGVEDCAKVSRELSDLLDVKVDIPGKYSLEVSSPGIFRPLVKPEDYERFKGEIAFVETHSPLNPESKKNTFKGKIKDSDQESVTIKLANSDAVIPFKKIKSARLNPDI